LDPLTYLISISLVPKLNVLLNEIKRNDQTDTLNKVKGLKKTFYYLRDETDTKNVNGLNI